MQSYAATRRFMSFLSFIAWCIILVGLIVAFGAGTAVSQVNAFSGSTSGMAGLIAAVPGLILAFMGFLLLVLAQIVRSCVDTAEYSQQMLKISRDQLEVSRQALRQGEALKQSFAALPVQKPSEISQDRTQRQSASFASAPLTPAAKEIAPLDQHELGQILMFEGKKIRVVEAGYLYNGIAYPNLDLAQQKIREGLALHTPTEERHTPRTRYKPGDFLSYKTKTIRVIKTGFVFDGVTFETLDEAKAKVDAEMSVVREEPPFSRSDPKANEVTPASYSDSFKRT